MSGTNALDGRVAIITGGTDGIGLATCRLFARQGAQLVVAARRVEPGAALVDELGAERCLFVPVDVAAPGAATRVVDAAIERFGRLDVLVNNAALDHSAPLLDADLAEIPHLFAVNAIAPLAFLQTAARVMVAAGGGSIVNVSSRLAVIGVPTMGIYGMTKGALSSLTRHAAVELAQHGIRVNTVAPGLTETPLIRAWIASLDDPVAGEQAAVGAVPQRRMATPEEVAEAILYFASDRSGHCTGASLPVDGGYTAA